MTKHWQGSELRRRRAQTWKVLLLDGQLEEGAEWKQFAWLNTMLPQFGCSLSFQPAELTSCWDDLHLCQPGNTKYLVCLMEAAGLRVQRKVCHTTSTSRSKSLRLRWHRTMIKRVTRFSYTSYLLFAQCG